MPTEKEMQIKIVYSLDVSIILLSESEVMSRLEKKYSNLNKRNSKR